jgi:hypothetical protein
MALEIRNNTPPPHLFILITAGGTKAGARDATHAVSAKARGRERGLARSASDHRSRGTEGSNPSPSSGESTANLINGETVGTARGAISNSRLIALDECGVTFRYKDYRHDGQARYRFPSRASSTDC